MILERVNSLSSYISTAMKYPMLDETEERFLAESFYYENNLEAAKKLVLHHMRLVISVASKFCFVESHRPDLIQAGNVGLLKAVKNFNPTLNVRLAVHAYNWIKSEIVEFLISNKHIMKIATTKDQRKIFFNISKYKRNSAISYDEAVYMANELNVSVKDVIEMDARLLYNLSTEELLDDESSDREVGQSVDVLKQLGYDGCPSLSIEEDEYESRFSDMRNAISTLNEREQDILNSRYMTDEKVSFDVLSKRHNISIERVRQLEVNAIAKLKKVLCNHDNL